MPFLPNATAKIYRTTDLLLLNPIWAGFTDANGRVVDAGGQSPHLEYGDYVLVIDHCDYNTEMRTFNIPADTLLAATVGCTSSISAHEAAYDHTKLNMGLTLPPGIGPLPYAGVTPPPGWLLCNGSAVSRIIYAGLFAVIGTAYGAGDGSTTFNLPDMRGRVPVGIGASGVIIPGDVGGEQNHILTVAEMPSHTHTTGLLHPYHANTSSGSGNTAYAGDTGPTGDGLAHNNMQPYIGVNYIISI